MHALLVANSRWGFHVIFKWFSGISWTKLALEQGVQSKVGFAKVRQPKWWSKLKSVWRIRRCNQPLVVSLKWGDPQIIQVIKPFEYWNLWFLGVPSFQETCVSLCVCFISLHSHYIWICLNRSQLSPRKLADPQRFPGPTWRHMGPSHDLPCRDRGSFRFFSACTCRSIGVLHRWRRHRTVSRHREDWHLCCLMLFGVWRSFRMIDPKL